MPSILITGANRGLGLEFCKQYAGIGWRVFACCRNPSSAQSLGELSKKYIEHITLHKMDIDNAQEVDAVANELSGQAVDVLLNNAGVADNYGVGVFEGKDDPDIRNYDFDLWLEILKTNVISHGRVTGAFIENVALSDRKLVVMVSSALGSIQMTNQSGRYAYRTSKAAQNMLMRGLAAWLEPRGITVASIAPGWTRTEMGGPRAMNSVEDATAGIRKTIERLSIIDTGTYWDWDGTSLPF